MPEQQAAFDGSGPRPNGHALSDDADRSATSTAGLDALLAETDGTDGEALGASVREHGVEALLHPLLIGALADALLDPDRREAAIRTEAAVKAAAHEKKLPLAGFNAALKARTKVLASGGHSEEDWQEREE